MIEPLPGDRMDHVRGVADQREPLGDERARHRQAERIGAARTGRLDLAEHAARSGAPARRGIRRRGSATMRSASCVSSVHTIDERRPFSGRMANGPAGRKCSSARP